MNSKDGSLINKVASLLVDKDLVKPYEAIDVTFANSRLNEIEQNIPLKSNNKTDPSIAPTITTSISNYGFCVPSITEERDMNNEPFIVASRGRNPENPSDRTSGIPTEQRLEPNTSRCIPAGTHGSTPHLTKTVVSEIPLRIRKLTPKECFRLMGFDDEDFYKAKWMKNLSYLVGGRKCSAKLKVVKEKQKLTDTETYALCTTRDSRDMETLRTILKSSVDKQENENQANVNIAIEWLDGMEHSECATNIIRCIDYMGMHFIMITGKEPQATDIIVQARVDNTSTGRFMKITTESNLNQSKLYTILTLFALIIESKIFTATTQQANINGCITLIEDCEKNVLMKISNLRMESIRERTSNSALYKQAGNSIVVDVLECIFNSLFEAKVLTE